MEGFSMSMISKLRSVPMTSAPEPEPASNDVKAPVPSKGVGDIIDGFESGNPPHTGIFTSASQRPLAEEEPLQQEAVDASTLFDSLAEIDDPLRVSDRITSFNSKMELHKAEAQDAEARLVKGYTSIEDLLKEMRK
jgi:hypothetical protein